MKIGSPPTADFTDQEKGAKQFSTYKFAQDCNALVREIVFFCFVYLKSLFSALFKSQPARKEQ